MQTASDVTGLRSLPVVVAAGQTSVGQVAYRTAVALADRLGKETESVPGDHGGFGSDPEKFAVHLWELLGAY